MKPGGGNRKGSAFERECCGKLSIWVSRGARADLFTRNDMSGGSFTQRKRKKQDTLTPGDIMAAHPMGNEFLSIFTVECKSYKDLGLDAFIFQDDWRRSFLGRVIEKCEKECRDAGGRDWLIIAKQNQRRAVALMAEQVGHHLILSCGRFAPLLAGHELHGGEVYMVDLERMLTYVSITKLLDFRRK